MRSLTEYIHTSKKARAGGFAAKYSYQRAIGDAFTGLTCKPIEG